MPCQQASTQTDDKRSFNQADTARAAGKKGQDKKKQPMRAVNKGSKECILHTPWCF